MQPQPQHLTRLRQLIPVGANGKLDHSILNTYVDAINNLIPLTANINTINRNTFRKARVRRFLSVVDEIIRAKGKCDILDVGGTLAYWQGLEPFWRDRPIHFTLVNVVSEPTQDTRFRSIAGDGRALDQFQDESFDVVHSNSVIEHVGGWREQWKMAAGDTSARAALFRADAEFLVSARTAFPRAVHPLAAGTLARVYPDAMGLRVPSARAVGRRSTSDARRRAACRRASDERIVPRRRDRA